jgi:hypothetical protein
VRVRFTTGLLVDIATSPLTSVSLQDWFSSDATVPMGVI